MVSFFLRIVAFRRRSRKLFKRSITVLQAVRIANELLSARNLFQSRGTINMTLSVQYVELYQARLNTHPALCCVNPVLLSMTKHGLW